MKNIKATIIDLYDNEPNQGIRCLKDILNETQAALPEGVFYHDLYETRYKNEIPGTDYDIYISSGGPGSPFDGEGSEWEKKYFNLLDKITAHNANNERKKYIFFICHSFQMMARYYKFGEVIKRHSNSFGIMPVHKTKSGKLDPLFNNLPDPFYGADFRSYQVIQPDKKVMDELGASVTALEKVRPHVDYERAVMAVRLSDEIFGTQFHPEADHASMAYHFKKPERQQQLTEQLGERKYKNMLKLLDNPNAIQLTRQSVIPIFLKYATDKLLEDTGA